VDWKWQTLACAAVVVVGHMLIMIVPESPRYLISKERSDEAMKSLLWLKNTNDVNLAQNELDKVIEALKSLAHIHYIIVRA